MAGEEQIVIPDKVIVVAGEEQTVVAGEEQTVAPGEDQTVAEMQVYSKEIQESKECRWME